ncbi:DUF2637 domain-containing protein [Nocardia sp. CA-135398]|uniref:DUF2637 domain-containing protein n=1 Tax=Nocardia sp. CA-135398 TaxID=3239977 RepID=UPI003D951011
MKAADQSVGMRVVRWSAVIIIAGVGAAAFRLSFATLRDLAVLAHIPAKDAWLFPVIVDGTIVLATLGAVVLAKSPERRWFTWVLMVGAAVSVVGNSLHAVAAGRELPWWASALVAAVAPISLLVDTHGLVVLFRAAQRQSVPEAEQSPAIESEPEQTEEVRADVAPTPAPAPVPVPKKRRAQRDPATVARAVAMRADGKSYAQIGKALGVSPRTAANYASVPAPAPAAAAVESRPLTSVTPVQSIRSSRPAQTMLPIAVPVGGI